jgi:hypothetical protein
MKGLIKFLSIILVVFSCTTNPKESLITHVTILDKVDFAKLEMDTSFLRDQLMHGKFYPLKIDLLNNSDSPMYYWTNSCSWQSNWILDHKTITWVVECPKNIPVIVKLMPHVTQSHFGIVELIDSSILVSNDFKLGFVLVRKNEVHNDIDFTRILHGKIKTKTDIYWSNSIVSGQKTNHNSDGLINCLRQPD